MECNEEDWSIECSDDEKYEIDGKVNKKEINNKNNNTVLFTWFTLLPFFFISISV